MNFLIDTHAFLWFINEDNLLSSTAKSLIEDSSNDIFLSSASLWEMAIKVSLGKLTVPQPFIKFMLEQLHENNITLLTIKPEHIGLVATMPFHHRDPFDRLIIAQSLTEKISLISKENLFDVYGVQRHW